MDSADYRRFKILMYAANTKAPLHNFQFKNRTFQEIVEQKREGETLVEIGSYALMPNHFHLVIRETREKGIANFMQKMLTGYTMYFNKRYERNGPLFAGVFKSKHVADDRYLKHLVAYVHLNPAELFDGRWKSGKADIVEVRKKLENYVHSSLPDFLDRAQRSEAKILGKDIFELYTQPTLKKLIADAATYYAEHI